jgi:putative glutathione S-transferase
MRARISVLREAARHELKIKSMGMVIAGRWTEDVPAETGTGGEFRRIASAFRDRITADGSSGFPAVAGRYHLYVGYHCPWAHRTIIFRALKKLEHAISISYCLPYFRENGWTYELRPEAPDCTLDQINGFHYLHQAYTRYDPGPLGQSHQQDRQQRVLRNHPHVQQRIRWHCGQRHRLLSGATAVGDRRAQ